MYTAYIGSDSSDIRGDGFFRHAGHYYACWNFGEYKLWIVEERNRLGNAPTAVQLPRNWEIVCREVS